MGTKGFSLNFLTDFSEKDSGCILYISVRIWIHSRLISSTGVSFAVAIANSVFVFICYGHLIMIK